jgi:hypothetical protein
MGLYQTEKLLSKKGKKSAESTNKMGANIWKLSIQQGINIQTIYKELKILNIKNANNMIKK